VALTTQTMINATTRALGRPQLQDETYAERFSDGDHIVCSQPAKGTDAWVRGPICGSCPIVHVPNVVSMPHEGLVGAKHIEYDHMGRPLNGDITVVGTVWQATVNKGRIIDGSYSGADIYEVTGKRVLSADSSVTNDPSSATPQGDDR